MTRRGLYGLYPENRPSPAPTGPALMDCFSRMCIVIVIDHGAIYRRLGQATNIQLELLRLLGIPPDSPDSLRTIKRRCAV